MSELALALFVTRVRANHTHDPCPANDAAGFTKSFYGWSNFHRLIGSKFRAAGVTGEGAKALIFRGFPKKIALLERGGELLA